ncbi:hypothetical protein ACOME3_004074 [Neoechinorhynchus agilis]
MRIAQIARSMRFGKLGHNRGRVQYTLSPYEINPYKDFFKRGVPNNWRWIKREAPWFILPGLFIFGLIKWARKANRDHHRKKPGQFDDEVLNVSAESEQS